LQVFFLQTASCKEVFCPGKKLYVIHSKSHTTQYATKETRMPLQQHFRSHYFPAVSVRHLDEDFATDTSILTNNTAHDGSTCAQLFVGMKSKVYKYSWYENRVSVPKCFHGLFFEVLGITPSLYLFNRR
jgi:hypothetical protein